jgi:hypothetical protein
MGYDIEALLKRIAAFQYLSAVNTLLLVTILCIVLIRL